MSLAVSDVQVNKQENFKAIKVINANKRAGMYSIPSEILNVNINQSADNLCKNCFKVSHQNKISSDWRHGLLVNISK